MSVISLGPCKQCHATRPCIGGYCTSCVAHMEHVLGYDVIDRKYLNRLVEEERANRLPGGQVTTGKLESGTLMTGVIPRRPTITSVRVPDTCNNCKKTSHKLSPTGFCKACLERSFNCRECGEFRIWAKGCSIGEPLCARCWAEDTGTLNRRCSKCNVLSRTAVLREDGLCQSCLDNDGPECVTISSGGFWPFTRSKPKVPEPPPKTIDELIAMVDDLIRLCDEALAYNPCPNLQFPRSRTAAPTAS